MKKVIIIGSPGSGKSTFAVKLGRQIGIPVIHLDKYYHDTRFSYYTNKEAWRTRVLEIMQQDEWIMDGNYSSTFIERFAHADTIIFFDYPTRLALLGLARRRVRFHRKKRSDMPDGWKETVSWEFIKHVITFRKRYHPKINQKLNSETNKKVIVFKKRTDANMYLKSFLT